MMPTTRWDEELVDPAFADALEDGPVVTDEEEENQLAAADRYLAQTAPATESD